MFRAAQLILFAAVSLPIAAPLFAQREAQSVAPTGEPRLRSIEGTVFSSTGSPVPGAIVLLKNSKTLQVRSFIAQQNGQYRFYGLSTDNNWELRAEANGMASKTKTVSVFDSHTRVRLNLKLDKKINPSPSG